MLDTEKKQKLFSRVLDLNHEMLHETRPIIKLELLNELTQAKAELKEEMGELEYNRFFEMGSKMFAPKSNDDGDDLNDWEE